jgi:hypothetical protein
MTTYTNRYSQHRINKSHGRAHTKKTVNPNAHATSYKTSLDRVEYMELFWDARTENNNNNNGKINHEQIKQA